MKTEYQRSNLPIIICLLLLLSGCDSYLDVKPDKSLVVPNKLEDFQALLDNDRQMLNQDIGLSFIGADNYYIPDGSWQSLYTNAERNAYIWAADIYEGESNADWAMPYEQVLIANVVLEGLEEINVTAANKSQWESIKGSALFFRSYAFYNLLQAFAPPYAPANSEALPGIPLKLSSNVEAPVSRATLQACYDEITTSVKNAASLLPAQSAYKTRPDKAAAYAFLSRVYLTMQDYEQAESYASQCLDIHNTLQDYSTLDSTLSIPFTIYHEEVIFHSELIRYDIRNRALVVPELYASYEQDDLRRALFFKDNGSGAFTFSGRYTGQSALFGGLATDEIYLIRAECRARLGDIEGALADLNTLLSTRWRPGTFVPFTSEEMGDTEGTLDLVLRERRKQLLFRGLRWTDLRRLNMEPEHAQTLSRTLNGEMYELVPGDPRYVYPIPKEETDLSGIVQNPR